jgi:CubicO group peptidase (beta-lactamase class C family)
LFRKGRRVSGKTYGDFLNGEIFQPLGMSDCALELSAELNKRAAAQYDRTSHARSAARRSDHPGASSEHCSVHDLALFGMFIIDQSASRRGQILSKESRHAILHSTVEAADGKRYGIGWWMNPNLYGYEVFYGSGGSNESAAALYVVPSEGLVVAALANTGTLLADQAAQEALAAVLPKFREGREKAQKVAKPADSPESTQSSALAGKWTGEIRTWQGVVPLAFSISPTGEVHVTVNSRDRVLQKASVELVGAATTRGDGPALPNWVTLQRAKFPLRRSRVNGQTRRRSTLKRIQPPLLVFFFLLNLAPLA